MKHENQAKGNDAFISAARRFAAALLRCDEMESDGRDDDADGTYQIACDEYNESKRRLAVAYRETLAKARAPLNPEGTPL